MSDERDPLEDRDLAQAEVATKRVVEQMDREGELAQLAALLEDVNVRDFLWRVMGWGSIFASVHDANNAKMNVMEGRRQLCLQLLAEINLANPQAWLAMQLKAAEVATAAAKVERVKQLRRLRSA